MTTFQPPVPPRSTVRPWRLITASLALATGLFAQADTSNPFVSASPLISISSGFDYSQGSYGYADDTRVFMVPVNLSIETGSWLFRAGLPWIRVDGPASVFSGGQSGSDPGRPTTASESGMGDATLGATYRFGPMFEYLNLDVTGRVKFPTASDTKGLGTGKTDFYWQADFSRSVGNFTPFLTAGYRFMGSSARYDLRNGVYASVGAVYRSSAYTTLGLAYDWRQRIVSGGAAAKELTGFLVHRFDDRWSLQTYAVTGFSDASPDFGGGALISYRY